MKRFFASILIFCLLVLSGCGGTEGDGNNSSTVSVAPPPVASNIIISEVMPDNKRVIMANDLDWIELFNAEANEVGLDGYFLTDDLSKPEELPLSGKTVAANGFLVITLDEAAPFHLSAKGETVYLMFSGKVISEVKFTQPEDGESFDKNGALEYPTPGFANTKEGYDAYLAAYQFPDLIISEVMSSNSQYLPISGQFYDLVEVQNCGTEPVKLSEYTLTDKHSEPERYKFPDVTLQPGECYVVYCSGNPSFGAQHTSFKISSDGERLYLTRNGRFTDALEIPSDLAKNESYGRADGKLYYFNKPSFGAVNTEGKLTAMAVPKADNPSGGYEAPITLTLTGEGVIYYTLDGSTPTAASFVYTDAIAINATTTVRAFSATEDRTSEIATYTYAIGATHTLPIVHINILPEYIDGEFGIINHPEKTYEYPAQVTMAENGEVKFSVPFGFRLHGHGSRYQPKQSFQLRFRAKYGQSKLEYKLFDDLELTEFNSLLLKGGSEQWKTDMMRDELATAVAHQSTQLYTQSMKPVVLYLNDKFWGVYYFRERFSDDYVSDHFNVSEESVHILNSTGAWAEKGSASEFKALRSYVQNHDMTDPVHFKYVTDRIDVNSLFDWYVCRTYQGDKDTGNVRRFKSTEGDGKWRWMYFDLDWAFVNRTNEKPITWAMNNSGGDKILINGLLKNPTGQDMFLKRYAELMNTVLNEQYIIALVDSIEKQIEPEMAADRARWGKSVGSWEKAVEKLRAFVRDGARDKTVLSDIKNYFSLTDEQMVSYFGDKYKA